MRGERGKRESGKCSLGACCSWSCRFYCTCVDLAVRGTGTVEAVHNEAMRIILRNQGILYVKPCTRIQN